MSGQRLATVRSSRLLGLFLVSWLLLVLFPEIAEAATISGRVTEGGRGLSGVTIRAEAPGGAPGEAQTDANGNYTVSGLSAGGSFFGIITYTVTPSKTGCTFTPASQTVTFSPFGTLAATVVDFTASCVAETPSGPAVQGSVTAFVAGLYEHILGRAPDQAGQDGFVRFLQANCNGNGFSTTIQSFFDSEEFRFVRPLSLTGLVTVLYRTLLGREPDPGGLAGWAGLFRRARLTVALQGFIPSVEFQMRLPDRRNRAAVTSVVTRFYTEILGRAPDPGGLTNFVNFIVATGDLEGAAVSFLASQEFEGRALTFRDYVTILYRAFLGRNPDPGGLAGWEGVLRATLLQVLNAGFIPSPEFQGLVPQMCTTTLETTTETASQMIAAAQGGTITLPSGNRVLIPSGMLPTDQLVTVSLMPSSPATQVDYFDTTAIFDAGPAASQVLIVDTGFTRPQADMSVTLKVPDSLLNSLGQAFVPQLYVQAFSENDDGTLDAFAPLDSTFDPTTKKLTAIVPEWGFTSRRNAQGTFESLLLIGSFPAPSSSEPFSSSTARDFQTAGCTIPLFSPLAGLTQSTLTAKIKPGGGYGLRRHPTTGELEFHQGPDYSFSNGMPVVPAAGGFIVRVGFSDSYGQVVIVQHDNGSQTLYAHLKPGSIGILNDAGVQYPTGVLQKVPGCNPILDRQGRPTGSVWCNSPPLPRIRVEGGESRIGIVDTTGRGVTGPHLHFEHSSGKISFQNPLNLPPEQFRIRMKGRLNAAECVSLEPRLVNLTVGKSGTGQGTVTSSPPGIACGPDCREATALFRVGSRVTLTASAADGSIFLAWGGDCAGFGTASCEIELNFNKTITATFESVAVISVSPTSQDFGTVTVGSAADRTFVVRNTGGEVGGTLTGNASTAAPFSIVSGGSFNLRAGASQTVMVRFSPTAPGTFSATVDFKSNGGDVSGLVMGEGAAGASNPFQGSLAGSWSGFCSSSRVRGTFSITIDASGGVRGNYFGNDSGSISGRVDINGNLDASGTAGGIASWTGQFTRSGNSLSGSGKWSGSVFGLRCSGDWSGP